MKVFMVEREMPGITLHELSDAKDAANRVAKAMRDNGVPINYLRTTFIPDDGRCMCLFEAETKAAVLELNDSAGLPYVNVVPAYDLTP